MRLFKVPERLRAHSIWEGAEICRIVAGQEPCFAARVLKRESTNGALKRVPVTYQVRAVSTQARINKWRFETLEFSSQYLHTNRHGTQARINKWRFET